MDYVRLGNSGLKVSRLCLGAMTYGTPEWRPWVLDEAASRPFIARALEHGINFFDTADMYSRGVSEQVLGRALKALTTRDQVVLATKAFYPVDRRPEQPRPVAQAPPRRRSTRSLTPPGRRLRRSLPDPPLRRRDADRRNPRSAPRHRQGGEGALHRRVEHARVAVHEDAGGLTSAHGWTRFVSMQNHYNLVYREEERGCCRSAARKASGDPLEPAGPRVPGRQPARGGSAATRSAPGPTTSRTSCITRRATSRSPTARRKLAARRGLKPTQVALAWLLTKPGVTAPIIGASRLPHLDEALAALDVRLDAAESCSFSRSRTSRMRRSATAEIVPGPVDVR